MRGVITDLMAKRHKVIKAFRPNAKKRELFFSPKLYLGDGIRTEDLEKLKELICKKPTKIIACLIVLAENEKDQLDIIATDQLTNSIHPENDLFVVGLAKTKDDAYSLILKMTQDCLADREDCSLKEFLTWR